MLGLRAPNPIIGLIAVWTGKDHHRSGGRLSIEKVARFQASPVMIIGAVRSAQTDADLRRGSLADPSYEIYALR